MSTSYSRKTPSTTLPRLAQPRTQLAREQVAAVCYRVNGHGIEFLLVQTRGGRWTFPKGGVEPGLTHAQTAALEAFEEAGVHGRMEEASFARYIGRKRGSRRSAATELEVKAHLCEVSYLGPPQESKRNPTWFPAEKAKRRLREDRIPDDAAELLRVIDRAAARIQRLRAITCKPTDALQQVQFEASPEWGLRGWIQEASFVPDLRCQDDSPGNALVTRQPISRLQMLPKNIARQSIQLQYRALSARATRDGAGDTASGLPQPPPPLMLGTTSVRLSARRKWTVVRSRLRVPNSE